jgi:uncharacterized glyoxalase superfamily protein PhnB
MQAPISRSLVRRISRMRSFRDAKAMAKSLRAALATHDIEISHAKSLEQVARQFDCADWTVLAAKIADADAAAASGAPGVRFSRTIPILRIFSVDKAMEFYVDFLGFEVDWEHRYGENFPLYTQISRGDLTQHLSEHHGDASPGSTVFVWMRGLAAFHRELSAKDYRYNKPGLEQTAYGATLMTVSDPFGNRIRFNEPIAADDPRA